MTSPNAAPAQRIVRLVGVYDADSTLRGELASGVFSGSSLNGFDSVRGRWHQCWMDSGGLVLDIYGGLVGDEMVMCGESQSGQSERISWTPLADGSVRQHWQQSTDQGVTWLTVFGGTYRRRPSQEPEVVETECWSSA